MDIKYLQHKLPIIEIFLSSLTLPVKHFRNLMRFGFFFIILNSIYVYASYYKSTWPTSGGWALLISALHVVYLFAIVLVVVRCHRLFLMDKADVKKTSVYSWTYRETRFIVWWIVNTICISIIALPLLLVMPVFTHSFFSFNVPQFVFHFVSILLWTPFAYILARWTLILPATAIDKVNLSFGWAWHISMGNGLRLTILIGILPIFTNSFFQFLPGSESLLYTFMVNTVWLIVCVIEIGLLSLSYANLKENEVTYARVADRE